MTVEFKNIAGFIGYEIGSDGSVWSLATSGPVPRSGARIAQRRKLVAVIGKKGYVSYGLTRSGKRINMLGHRLVLEAFVGPAPTTDHEGAHGNGIRSDNRLENLRWATPKENDQDKIAHGTRMTGEKHHCRKLNCSQVAKIRERRLNGESLKSLARDFGVSIQAIWSACKRQTWSHVP